MGLSNTVCMRNESVCIKNGREKNKIHTEKDNTDSIHLFYDICQYTMEYKDQVEKYQIYLTLK